MSTWFDYLEESFSYRVVQFKTFCLPPENVYETPSARKPTKLVLVYFDLMMKWQEFFLCQLCNRVMLNQ